MKIQVEEKNGASLVTLEGELDFHSSPELREKLNALTDKKKDKIIVCLQNVAYMDSSGIATFVEALQKSKKYQGKLVLAELTAPVRSVFEIAKLDSIFDLAASLDEAFQKIGG